MSKPKNVWEEFFKDKKHGGHRYSTEEFLAMEAREKLFHLDGGKTLLDFGCGSAELLTYYAPEYEKLVGVDFSPSMLGEASKRIRKKGCDNIDLILANHETLWEKLEFSFDRITAAGVIQYLTLQEIDKFIFDASKYLNREGIKNRPKDILGFAYNPNKIEKIANKHGFRMIYVCSMYYEYKYHAIMFRA